MICCLGEDQECIVCHTTTPDGGLPSLLLGYFIVCNSCGEKIMQQVLTQLIDPVKDAS